MAGIYVGGVSRYRRIRVAMLLDGDMLVVLHVKIKLQDDYATFEPLLTAGH
jgi:hypothetical protein